jgi:voltage-gated sodium channel
LWGALPQSLISLQQMSLSDDWGTNLRATMAQYPYAWIFFQIFLIIMTYMLLNLFIGIIVDAMQSAQQGSNKSVDPNQQILKELADLKKQVALLTQSHLSISAKTAARKKKDGVKE